MASFYGNIKNNSRASFIFDRFYESKYAMDRALTASIDENGEIKGDGVFVNRYVLINYGYTEAGGYVRIDPAYVQANGDIANSHSIVTANNYRNFYTYDASNKTYNLATTYYTRQQLTNDYYYYKKINFYDRYESNAFVKVNPNLIQANGEETNSNNIVTAENYTNFYIIDILNGGYKLADIYYTRAQLDQGAAYYEYKLSRVENSYFASNRDKDRLIYHADYHLTVWMKIYTDNQERYIQVGRLKAEAPAFEAITDAPGELAPHFDLVQSSDISYMYHVPAMWDIKLNTAEDNTAGITYPYFNMDGFDEVYNKNDRTNTNEITMPAYQSGRTYPTHVYQEIDITPDTYIRNWYYTKSGSTYTLSTGDYSGTATYYMKTQKQNANGNAISDMYDALYGFQGYGAKRKYTRSQLFNTANIEPYNNLSSSDKVSMAWGVQELKKYISELRFLSNGRIDGEPDFQNHGGL